MSAPLSRRLAAEATVLLAAATAMVMGMALYIQSERFFPYWDNAFYEETARGLYQAFQLSFSHGLDVLSDSMSTDYNALWSLPAVAAFALFEPSRLTFILTLTIVYAIPAALAVGLLAARGLVDRDAFAPAAFIAMASTLAWSPTSAGLPDTGGVALIAIALALLVTGTRPRLARLASGGALIGLAFVFRKHFAYAGLAVMAVLALREALSTDGLGPRQLTSLAVRLLVPAVTGIAVITLLVPKLAIRAVTQDYGLYYGSYLHTPLENVGYYAGQVGWLPLGFALLGLILPLVRRRADRGFALSITAFLSAWAVLWLLAGRQVGPQFALHALGIAVPIGLVLLARSLPAARVTMTGVAAAVWLLLAVTFMSQAAILRDWIPTVVRTGLPPVRLPHRHAEYDTIRSLVAYLRVIARPEDRIRIAASSNDLNGHMVATADRTVFPAGPPLKIDSTPEVDGRDPPPFDGLAWTDILAVADPAQLHLGEDRQQVVVTVVELFRRRHPVTAAFEPMPKTFTLASSPEQSVVTVWRRTGPTDPIALQAAVREMAPRVEHASLPPRRWVVLDSPSDGIHSRPLADGWAFSGRLPAHSRLALLAVPEPEPAGEPMLVSFGLRVTPRTCPAAIEMSSGDTLGNTTDTLVRQLEIPRNGTTVVSVRSESADGCQVDIALRSPPAPAEETPP